MIDAARPQVKPIGFQFVAVPVELLSRTDLSPAAKLLAGVVLESARGSRAGVCRLSNASLGSRIGLSAASAKRLLAELEAAGVLKRETIAEGRIRTAIRPTWVDRIRSTEQAHAAQIQPRGGSDLSQGEGQIRATIQNSGSEKRNQTGSLDLDSGEKKPTQAEIAAALRSMVAGTFAPMMFGEAKPEAMPEAPRGSKASLPAKPDPNPGPGAPGGLQGEPGVVRTMFGRIGYSARAAAFRRETPRKSAADQIAELRARSAAREREGANVA